MTTAIFYMFIIMCVYNVIFVAIIYTKVINDNNKTKEHLVDILNHLKEVINTTESVNKHARDVIDLNNEMIKTNKSLFDISTKRLYDIQNLCIDINNKLTTEEE